MRELKLEHVVTTRDLDGFFEHVWTVNPSIGASPLDSPHSSVGLPSSVHVSARHTVLEGKVSQFRWLRRLPGLNFAIAQAVLIAQLIYLIRRRNVTVIKAADPFYTGLLGLVISRATGIPLVVCVNANHDHMYEATGDLLYPRLLPSRKLEKSVARFVLSRADLIAAGNEDNRLCAVANGGSSEKSTLFRCGTWVHPIHFEVHPRERKSLRSELELGTRPFVIVVGRLEPPKHPEDVLAVLSIAQNRHPDLALVFVGDGTMRTRLELAASEMGLTDDVRFVGNRDQEWIAHALTSADVAVCPLGGRALVEACLSGTPVVAYDIEWHSELISTGDTGILVPYRSTQAMAEAVGSLIRDQAGGAAIGEQGRAAALEMMLPSRLWHHERSEYLKLLQGVCRSVRR